MNECEKINKLTDEKWRSKKKKLKGRENTCRDIKTTKKGSF